MEKWAARFSIHLSEKSCWLRSGAYTMQQRKHELLFRTFNDQIMHDALLIWVADLKYSFGQSDFYLATKICIKTNASLENLTKIQFWVQIWLASGCKADSV